MVFKGALTTLNTEKPIVMTEILRKWSAKYGYNPNEIFKTFARIGYRSFTTDGQYLIPFHEMDNETIETNFFFLHEDMHCEEILRYRPRKSNRRSIADKPPRESRETYVKHKQC